MNVDGHHHHHHHHHGNVSQRMDSLRLSLAGPDHWLDLVREGWIIFVPKLTLPTGYPKHLGSAVLLNKIPAVLIKIKYINVYLLLHFVIDRLTMHW